MVPLILISMPVQLHLIDDAPAEWTLSETTRQIGRRGLAEARQVLHSIPRRSLVDTTATALPEPSTTQHQTAA